MELTNTQKAQIYCIKHGHAKYITSFMGYISCGRCGQQIGDTLGGVFDLKGYLVTGHIKNDCELCMPVYDKLTDIDQLIFKRLERDMSQEEALKGIDFNE